MKKKTTRKTPARKIVKPKEPKTGVYLGQEYESFCELSCLFFAEELIKLGYVERVERCPTYLLCDPVQHTYAERLKRGSKHTTQTISQGVSYTPDFDIYFTDKALGKFCWEMGSSAKWEKNLLVAQSITENGKTLYRACCEVKPDFSRASTTPKSVQSMKWLMQKHKVYTNLFRPNRIFEGLFTPEKYLKTDKGKQRLIKYKSLTLQQYLNKIKTK